MRALNTIVYFSSILITLMTIVLILVNNELGHVPEFLTMLVLTMVFVVGALLFYIVFKQGLRSKD